MRGLTLHTAAGGSNAEPAENSARGAALRRWRASKESCIVTQPSLAPRVSASSAFEPGEEETPDSLILSAAYSASSRLRAEMESDSFASNSMVRVLQPIPESAIRHAVSENRNFGVIAL